MILRDNEIVLRAIEETEVDLLHRMINDPETERMVVGWSFPVSKAEQIRWIQNKKNDDTHMRYIVEVDKQAVGMASLSDLDYKNSVCELNIKLDGCAKGQGFGYRVIKMLLHYCFNELNLNCATAEILDYNIPSQKLFEKCGFKKEGVLRQRVYKDGGYHNLLAYSILKDEFFAK